MSRVKTVSVLCLLFFMFLVISSIGNPQTTINDQARAGQGQVDNAQTMQALLSEVRQLRLAIQQSNLSIYRAQVIVERMRTEQQQVDRLTERLRETREGVNVWKREQSDVQDELKFLEVRINRTTNAAELFNQEEQQQRLKARMAFMAQENTRMQEQESQLTQQLILEQGKLSDFNDQLDALQRELETQPAENQPGQGIKRQ